VEENIRRDKGSLYRYGDEHYGSNAPRFYLQQIEEDIQSKYIPAFLSK
jgi:asparagine synthase (glutamine-hydrolysing)